MLVARHPINDTQCELGFYFLIRRRITSSFIVTEIRIQILGFLMLQGIGLPTPNNNKTGIASNTDVMVILFCANS